MNIFSVGVGNQLDMEGMVIYSGEGINGVYNMPYFDNTMKTNYSVQVCILCIQSFQKISTPNKHNIIVIN